MYIRANRPGWRRVCEVTWVRIALADERQKVRFALRALLQRQEDMEVVGEATTAQELISLVERDEPDLILVDNELPGMELPDLVQVLRTRRPETIVIALSGRAGARQRAEKAGADAFVSKGDPPERLLSAIQGCVQRCARP